MARDLQSAEHYTSRFLINPALPSGK